MWFAVVTIQHKSAWKLSQLLPCINQAEKFKIKINTAHAVFLSHSPFAYLSQ